MRTFLQLPNLLIAACLIVQYADNDVFVYGFPTTCSILQYFLGLSQVHQSLFCTLYIDAVLSINAQLHNPVQKLFWILWELPLLVISLRVEGVISTSFFSSDRLGSVYATLYWWDMSKRSAIVIVISKSLYIKNRCGLPTHLYQVLPNDVLKIESFLDRNG